MNMITHILSRVLRIKLQLLGIGIAAHGLVGCSLNETVRPDDPYYAPVSSDSLKPKPVVNGSIFHAAMMTNGAGLYTDTKAMQIGDIIEVKLSESTDSKKSAKNKLEKDYEMDFGSPSLGGVTPSLGAYDLSFAIENAQSFEGKNQSNMNNSLKGSISVTVVDVLPNGNLVVRGEKWMTLNTGDEYIRLSGMIRPEDIMKDNTITSNKVADARIAYSGTGSYANTQKEGLLSKFFMSPWWIF